METNKKGGKEAQNKGAFFFFILCFLFKLATEDSLTQPPISMDGKLAKHRSIEKMNMNTILFFKKKKKNSRPVDCKWTEEYK